MVNLPLVGWGLDVGFAYRDANLDNTAVLEQFLAMNRATGMDDFQASYARIQGMPWVNTMAADRTGRAWYIDASATPNLSPAAQARFRVRVEDDLIAALLYENRVPLLDGSEPDDDWLDDPTANRPGVVGHPHLPQLERRDVVANANDSHWLTNPAEPLEGHSVFHGFERTARTLRTRQNLRVVQRLAATGTLTVEEVLAAVWDNASLSAELLRDDVVTRCRAVGSFPVDDEEIDLHAAADVLAAWDGRFDLDSVGAVLWREFMAGFPAADIRSGGSLFAHPFDPADPVATPHGLAPEVEGFDPTVLALAAAVVHLRQAGVALDARLGDVQWAQRGAERVPVHGGGEADGVTNILAPVGALSTASLEPGHPPLAPVGDRTARTGLAEGGYRCTYGTSFLMAVELTDDGPRALGLLAYGQSGDPRSEHHVDGTRAYAAKAPRPLLFADADIEADPHLVRRSVSG
jgi:acyl-homoserine-lactone acylase